MPAPWTVLIASHAIAATVALLLGPVQILRPTKGDRVHIALGRIWAACMLFVAAGSFFFGGFSTPLDIFLRALAVYTLFSVTSGVCKARKGDIAAHRGFMVGTYFGLVAAFVGVVAFRSRLVPSWFVAYPLMMSLVAVAIIAVTGFIVGGVLLTQRRRPAVAPH